MLMPTRSAVSTVLGLLFLLSCRAIPLAHAEAIVLPPDMAAVEGTGSFTRPLSSEDQTTQYAYDSSLLAGVPAGSLITGFQFRPDRAVRIPDSPLVIYENYEVTVSTSNFAPGSLSSAYADNIADDAVVARYGALAFAADDIPIGGSPNAFGPFIGFTTPFSYRGGDLLLTIRHTGGGLRNLVLVDVREDDTALQSVFSDGADATVGFALGGAAPIIQITFVPENPFEQAAVLADQVAVLVANGLLNSGQGQSLVSKLTLTGRGRPDAGRIGAFINELQALLDSGRLTPAQADPLLAAARALLFSVTAG